MKLILWLNLKQNTGETTLKGGEGESGDETTAKQVVHRVYHFEKSRQFCLRKQ